MTKTLAPAKTPGVAIARILRGLGLKQGTDFRVRAERKNGERIGTRVAVLGRPVNRTVADNADLIEQLAGDAGFHFNVSTHFTPSGIVWVDVANFGKRTRQTHFLSNSGRTENTATEAPKPVIRATLGAPRPAFEQPETLRHRPGVAALCPDCAEAGASVCVEMPKAPAFDPYAGLAKRHMGSRVWGCGEAGQMWFFQKTEHGPRYTLRVYLGRAQANGWYLSGPGVGPEAFMATSLGNAAVAADAVIKGLQQLTDVMEQVVRDFPKGQRIQGVDNYGVTCMGTVNGVAWGAVSQQDHRNYGRTWVDVDWDEMPHNRGTGRRSRPFSSELIKH